jgi:hypothetical protein
MKLLAIAKVKAPASANNDDVPEVIVMSKLRERLEDMYKTIDAYHAWQRALPKP